ncbi:unnamed protein product, partial [marine sediment metagenome]
MSIDKELFKFIKNHKNVEISEQAIRNAISKIRSENPGLTSNAAACIFAESRRFKVMRFLKEADRESLQKVKMLYNKIAQTNIQKRIKFKPAKLSFGIKFAKDANKNAEVYPYIYILENSLRTL